jgi:hypothetical protein
MMIQIKVPYIGFVTNPFYQGHLRNKLCACFSGKKVKRCHGAEPYIEEEELDKLLSSMKEREEAVRQIV